VDVARAKYLTSAEGVAALAGLSPKLAELSITRLSSELRKQFSAGQAAALGEQIMLRAKASERFGETTDWLFAPSGLEMMTHPLVARRRAARLQRAGLPVADLTCGLGGDLGAVAQAGMDAVGVERDPATALLAAQNVRSATVVVGDAEAPPVWVEDLAILLDPSRRSAVTRRFDPAAFQPTWDVCMQLAQRAKAAVVKGPPGIGDAYIPPEAEFEVVQVGRSLREGALWFGGDAVPGLRRAVRLPQAVEITSEASQAPPETSPILEFLFDPAPCVTRASLVRHLGARINARLLDPFLAYLTASQMAETPFATAFEVLEVVPFSVAGVRKTLRENGWRPDEIRRRAFPIEPDELRKLLKVHDGEPVTLLCMTVDGSRMVVISRRIDSSV